MLQEILTDINKKHKIRNLGDVYMIEWLQKIIDHNKVKNVRIGDVYQVKLNSKTKTKNNTLSPRKNEVKQPEEKEPKETLNVVLLSIIDDTGEVFHGNVIIINHFSKTYERFEPYGSLNALKKNIDKHINSSLQNEFKRDFNLQGYKFIEPELFCPYFGPQTYTDSEKAIYGTCAIWSVWYAEQRILNPKKSPPEIIDELLAKGGNYMRQMITEYILRLKKDNTVLYKLMDARFRFAETLLEYYKNCSFLKSGIKTKKDCEKLSLDEVKKHSKQCGLRDSNDKAQMCENLIKKTVIEDEDKKIFYNDYGYDEMEEFLKFDRDTLYDQNFSSVPDDENRNKTSRMSFRDKRMSRKKHIKSTPKRMSRKKHKKSTRKKTPSIKKRKNRM